MVARLGLNNYVLFLYWPGQSSSETRERDVSSLSRHFKSDIATQLYSYWADAQSALSDHVESYIVGVW